MHKLVLESLVRVTTHSQDKGAVIEPGLVAEIPATVASSLLVPAGWSPDDPSPSACKNTSVPLPLAEKNFTDGTGW